MSVRDGRDSSFLRGLEPDGLLLQPIKEHSLEKYRRHNRYAHMFATSMKSKWPERAYVGLYSGAGRARVEPSGEIVETTALSVLRLPHPFTKYVFVDKDPACIAALKKRTEQLRQTRNVSLIEGDVDEVAEDVLKALPGAGANRGLLSFCFVDPFSAELSFRTIRALGSRTRMDFLILLALGVDLVRNFRRYHDDPTDRRIENLIDSPNWRAEYASGPEKSVVRFVLQRFEAAMTGLGYLQPRPHHYYRVRVRGTGVMQYLLVVYSKHRLGQRFWETALAGADRQTGLDLFPEI